MANRMINLPHVRNRIQRKCIISFFIAVFNINTYGKDIKVNSEFSWGEELQPSFLTEVFWGFEVSRLMKAILESALFLVLALPCWRQYIGSSVQVWRSTWDREQGLYVYIIYLTHKKQWPEDITDVVSVLHILFSFHANVSEIKVIKTV